MTMYTNKIEIQNWLDEHAVSHYVINDNLTVDVNNNVKFIPTQYQQNQVLMNDFPIKFGKILGDFEVYNQNFSSFKNFPNTIRGTLNIYNNNFTSLKDMPSYIGQDFICGDNLFQSFDDLKAVIKGRIVHLSRIKNTQITDFFHQYESKDGELGHYSILVLEKKMLDLIYEKNNLAQLLNIDSAKESNKKLKI
jgi:hypothetical protein